MRIVSSFIMFCCGYVDLAIFFMIALLAFWLWAQPMRDDATLQRRLSLVEAKPRKILAQMTTKQLKRNSEYM